jgi:hypothetical protein
LSFDLRMNSASESGLKSCASSRRRITSWAISSFKRASESTELLHFFKACEVE